MRRGLTVVPIIALLALLALCLVVLIFSRPKVHSTQIPGGGSRVTIRDSMINGGGELGLILEKYSDESVKFYGTIGHSEKGGHFFPEVYWRYQRDVNVCSMPVIINKHIVQCTYWREVGGIIRGMAMVRSLIGDSIFSIEAIDENSFDILINKVKSDRYVIGEEREIGGFSVADTVKIWMAMRPIAGMTLKDEIK
jgi:hypothetical protein